MSWRYLLTLPLAGGVTCGLAMSLRVVTATEFAPQPTDWARASLKTYIIEPQMIICGCNGRHAQLTFHYIGRPPMQRVKCDYPVIENPHDDRVSYRAPKPEFLEETIQIDIPSALFETPSCQGVHSIRVPPKFPVEFLSGNTSGLCEFSFIYGEDGQAHDIEILSCTHKVLGPATREAIKRWHVSDSNCFGENLPSQRRFSTLRYDLLDEDGSRLPLP